ncbi:MAG: gliding motility-associated protein GldE [Prevotellaceae bacterium]|nr:gliding motility-associated protein GldE [Prevotellaceae bacterium]
MENLHTQLNFVSLSPDFSLWFTLAGSIVVLLLLVISALVSGSETAYFSLSPSDINTLKSSHGKSAKTTLQLLERPDYLLSCILLANNVINVAIVIISTYITHSAVVFHSPVLGFVFEVIIITFLLLLFGEITPKIFARYTPRSFALAVALPLFALSTLTRPFSFLLVGATSRMNRHIKPKRAENISMDDLSNALNVTKTPSAEDKKILKGIVKFGNIDVREIMTPRIDAVGIEIATTFDELLKLIVQWEYSRLPVYEESFDNVKGMLYIKDLLKHLEEKDFAWQTLMRPAYFVPENKKINDLLEEFQHQKNHMAIVVDEYGGTFGIVTLEDILEEIVGEISDESDMDETLYKKQSDGTYIFEGKTLLNDFCKVMNLPDNFFDDINGDSETLAGVLLELKGNFPAQGEEIRYRQLRLTVASFEGRRIQKIRIAFDEAKKVSEKL